MLLYVFHSRSGWLFSAPPGSIGGGGILSTTVGRDNSADSIYGYQKTYKNEGNIIGTLNAQFDSETVRTSLQPTSGFCPSPSSPSSLLTR